MPQVSFNPCTMPYLGVILAVAGSDAVLHLAAFSLGLITPAVLFTLFGQSLLWTFQEKSANVFHYISKFMSIVLVVSGLDAIPSYADAIRPACSPSLVNFTLSAGLFLVSTMRSVKMPDIWLAVALMIVCFATVIRVRFSKPSGIASYLP